MSVCHDVSAENHSPPVTVIRSRKQFHFQSHRGGTPTALISALETGYSDGSTPTESTDEFLINAGSIDYATRVSL